MTFHAFLLIMATLTLCSLCVAESAGLAFNLDLGASLINRTQANFVERLIVIDQVEVLVRRLLERHEPTKLAEAGAILGKLKNDIKQIGVDAVREINTCFYSLNTILHGVNHPPPVSQQQRQKRNAEVKRINELGLNFTIKTMEQTQTNFKELIILADTLDRQLSELLGGNEQKQQSALLLAETRRSIGNMKELLANYETKVLVVIHEAILTLNQHVHLYKLSAERNKAKNANDDDDDDEQSRQLVDILKRQMKIGINMDNLMLLINSSI